MELQTKDNRNYTNQLPQWAIGCHIGLITIFLALAIGIFVLSIKEVSDLKSGIPIVLFSIGIVFLAFVWFGYKNLRQYLDNVIHIQLGEKGYDYYVKDKKKGEEHHFFLPYENMRYVLIGMDYRLKAKSKIHSGENSNIRTKFVPVRSAKIIICGVDTNNQIRVTSFPHADQRSLDDWIDVFQKRGVEIFHTDKALTATPSNPDVIESIPKQPYDGTLSFEMGSVADGLENIFLTEEQQKLVSEYEKKNRKNGFLFTILLSVLQVMMICFWFPSWDIVEKSFSDSSGEFFAIIMTFFLQFFIYIKMGRVKWYEPIRDMMFIYIGILIGLQLSPDERTTFHPAVHSYGMMTIGSILILFYFIKISSWFKKLGETRQKEESR